LAILNIHLADAQTLQSTVKLTVTDPRPVAAAVQELVSRYGYVITYEDPRRVYERDLEDVTTQVRKDLHKYPISKRPKIIVPLNTTLALDIPSASSITTQDLASILEQLMQAQMRTGLDGHFRVEHDGQVFHVVPTEVRDQSGNWTTQTSVWDVVISLPMEDRSATEIIDAICRAVSAAIRIPVSLTFPVGHISDPSRPRPYHFGANNERARDALMRGLDLFDAGQRRTWVLFYDSGNQGSYFLTIEGVPNRSSVTSAPGK
jgi:hypothetical protein